MTGLSVAEIDRWKPGDVREVFHATRSRAEANQLARDGLATLPAFQTWGGVAADAAKNSVIQTVPVPPPLPAPVAATPLPVPTPPPLPAPTP